MTSQPPNPEATNPAEKASPGSQFEKDFQTFELQSEAYKQSIIDQSVPAAPEGYQKQSSREILFSSFLLYDDVLKKSGLDIVFVWPGEANGAQANEDFVQLYVSSADLALYQQIMHEFGELYLYDENVKRGNLAILLAKTLLGQPSSIIGAKKSGLVGSEYGEKLAASEDAETRDLISRAFLTAMLKQKQYFRARPDLPSKINLKKYEKISRHGMRPLEFVQLSSLAQSCLDKVFEDHPELHPSKTSEAKGL